jgi:HPt (histidine-containing phosphotransfer) domain-containing protein
MDVQMPEMDGLEATLCIRDPQSAVLNHAIPVIAMTANALQGDREHALDSGMNDYVTKPVSPTALGEALDRWLPEIDAIASPPATISAPTESVATGPATEGNSEPTIFDHADLVDRLMGDEALAREIIGEFLRDTPEQIAALKASVAEGDLAGSARQAHSMKGVSANVGCEALRAAAYAAEKAGQAGDLDAIIACVSDIELQFGRLTTAMREFSEPDGAKSGGPS